ncbi:MAG TPA: AAA family ATPase, partial [Variovorax sp.]|nr:AAA family ATPase [Variovorax sp.]
MELEIPELLAATLQGQIGAQSPLGLQLGGQGAASGTRVVSSHHFDGHSLNLLYQLSRAAGARDLVFQLLALDNLNGEAPVRPMASLEQMVPALIEWLGRDLIDGWMYQRGRDGVLLAWLVHS